MPKKRKKKKEKKEKKLPETVPEEISPSSPSPSASVVATGSLEKQIGEISAGLFYMSETDEEIFPFTGEKAAEVTAGEILKQTGSAPDLSVEEREFEGFFERLTKIQDWFGEEETIEARKFLELKNLLEDNLRELKVFKLGIIDLDIYAVGLDKEGRLTGIKTKATET